MATGRNSMQQPAQDQAIKIMNPKRRRKFSKTMDPIHISMSGVTLREAEVVGWVARGLSNMEIAFQLQISSRRSKSTWNGCSGSSASVPSLMN
jgi:ATP/maltotriose-dependent transcriptional regulator MalT